MKWSPELKFIHFDDSEVAELEAEEARQSVRVEFRIGFFSKQAPKIA